MQMAVVGRVGSGKSTLVNALVGRRIAPTGAAETTRIVVRLTAGDDERAEAELRDGRRWPVGLTPEGSLPDSLNGMEEVEQLHVELPQSRLPDRIGVIDTPGLSSANDRNSARTRELLASEAGSRGGVDALILVLNRNVNEDDIRHLSLFSGPATPFATLAVLGRIDQLSGRDPLKDGNQLARGLFGREELRRRVSTVLPVAGLLAQAVATDALDGRVLRHLRELARQVSPHRLDQIHNEEAFVELCAEHAVPELGARACVNRLGLWGVHAALAVMGEGATDDVVRARLADLSGIAELRSRLQADIYDRADEIQAVSAALRLGRNLPPRAGARAALADALNEASLHAVHEVLALSKLADAGDSEHAALRLPPELEERIRTACSRHQPRARLGLPADAARSDVRSAAVQLARQVAAWAAAAPRTSARLALAGIVRKRCALIVQTIDATRNDRP